MALHPANVLLARLVLVSCALAACSSERSTAPDVRRASLPVVATPPSTMPSVSLVAKESPPPPASAIEPPAPARPTERFTLKDTQGRPIEVYPPTTPTTRVPLMVFLHATCMKPASVCDWFGDVGRDKGWLVCPSGNSTCYGEPDWNGTGPQKATHLENAMTAVRAEVASFVDEQPGVLIGWSRGAYAARDILATSVSDPKHASLTKRFRGLVLIAAQVAPDVSVLRAAGITRVVMAAGDYDGARPTMTKAVASLSKSGIASRYVSLGKIGHWWPEDFDARMRESIAWAAGE